MALKSIRSIFTAIFILILFLTLIPTSRVRALSKPFRSGSFPSLNELVNQVKNGQADELRGIYIPEFLAARIVQQPKGNDEFISPWPNTVTQFGLASKLGSTGLLAHNYLAGESLSLLEEDQEFYLVYGDGQVSAFVVKEILRYKAVEPANTSSHFVGLANGDLLTASELFLKVYNRPGHVIFQTCISADDNSTWGRLFILAEPYLHKP